MQHQMCSCRSVLVPITVVVCQVWFRYHFVVHRPRPADYAGAKSPGLQRLTPRQ